MHPDDRRSGEGPLRSWGPFQPLEKVGQGMARSNEGWNPVDEALVSSEWMNTFNPHIVRASCILKGGDKADRRMTELNELIASAKASDKARGVERLRRPVRPARQDRAAR